MKSVQNMTAECNFKALQRCDLDRHIKSVHDSEIYDCNQCDYKALWLDSIQRHITTIHECTKYDCDHCDYQASQRSDLKSHIKSVHEGTSKYDCNWSCSMNSVHPTKWVGIFLLHIFLPFLSLVQALQMS